jgi:hypothetical protein
METSDHLFVGCHFVNKVWQLTLQGLKVAAPTSISVVDLFTGWKDSHSSLSLKTLWARIWISIPKYVCWKLWLARNEQIFNNTEWTPKMVAAKAKGLLLETLNSQNHKTDTSIRQKEKKWLGSSVLNLRTHSVEKSHLATEWRLRDSHDIFQSWWQKHNEQINNNHIIITMNTKTPYVCISFCIINMNIIIQIYVMRGFFLAPTKFFSTNSSESTKSTNSLPRPSLLQVPAC